MNRSLYTRFGSAYLVLDGITCEDWAQSKAILDFRRHVNLETFLEATHIFYFPSSNKNIHEFMSGKS